MDKRIEAFLDNRLSEQEIRLLEEELKTDKSLAEELAFYLSVKKLAYQKSRQLRLEDRHKEWRKKTKETPVIPFKKWAIPAIAAALLISFGLAWLLRTSPDMSTFSTQYIDRNFHTLSVEMSGTGEKDSIQTAIRLFNEGDPGAALAMTESILERDPNHTEALKTGGIAALRTKNYDKAITLFRRLGDEEQLYGNPGRFYEALARLGQGGAENKKRAEVLLDEVVSKGLVGKKEIEKWKSGSSD